MGRGITDSPLRSRRDLPPEYETQYPGLTYRHYLNEGTLPVDYWLMDIESPEWRAYLFDTLIASQAFPAAKATGVFLDVAFPPWLNYSPSTWWAGVVGGS